MVSTRDACPVCGLPCLGSLGDDSCRSGVFTWAATIAEAASQPPVSPKHGVSAVQC